MKIFATVWALIGLLLTGGSSNGTARQTDNRSCAWCGMVISNAANCQANVKALVFVAAFAPDVGENAGDLNSKFPGSLVGPALAPPVPLLGGGHDLYIRQEKFHDAFAPDVPADAATLAAAA